MSCLGDVFCHHPLSRLIQTYVFLAFLVLRLSRPVDIYVYLATHAHGVGYLLRTNNSPWPDINVCFVFLYGMTHSAVLIASGRQSCCQPRGVILLWSRGPILSPKRNAWFAIYFLCLIILNHQVRNSAQEATNFKEWPLSLSAPVCSSLSSF